MESSVTGTFTHRLLSMGLPKVGVYRGNPKTATELKEAIRKEITSNGSEVTKTVLDCMKKNNQDCNQSGGHHL